MRQLFLALIFAATMSGPAIAGSTTIASYGGATLRIPTPEGYCQLGQEDEFEKAMFDWQFDIQKSVGNKLLAFWADCPSLDNIRNGIGDGSFEQWVMVTASNTGNEGEEGLLEDLSRAEFRRMVARELGVIDLDNLMDDMEMDNVLESANLEYLGDANAVSLGEIVSLGILGMTESVHYGVIQSIASEGDSDLVGGVFGMALLKGVYTNFYFYAFYENKGTVESLLAESKRYSAKLNTLN